MAYQVGRDRMITSLWERGLTLDYSNDNMKDLQCMTYTSKGTSEVLAAGLQDQMFIINVDKGTITRQV